MEEKWDITIMGGPCKNGVRQDLHEAAEEFAKEDPFVLNGKVIRWHVREWNNMLM